MGFAIEVALSGLNLVLSFGKHSGKTLSVDQEKDDVLDDERCLAFKPAVGHLREGSYDEDHKTGDGNASSFCNLLTKSSCS
jgi:hypothetical protein